MKIFIKRTNRKKTISIEIKDNKVEVKAPYIISQKEIESFILQKKDWIDKKISFHNSIKKPIKRRFIEEENFQFLGKDLKLKIIKSNKRKNYLDGKFIYIFIKNEEEKLKEKIKKELEILFKYEALKIFERKTNFYARKIGVYPKKITIKSYKKRWGSCSYKEELSYNWKLIMAPEKIIDYVIIHELCHLIHFNHSKDYWEKVSKILPNYKTSKEWLKINQHLLIW